MSGSFPIGAMLLGWSSALLAQEGPLIEEIIVSAQRVEENSQKVPIALNAFSDAMLQDRQIIGLTDIQLNAPNVQFSSAEFGDWLIQVRGIDAVSTHLNEIELRQSFNALEFYDMERVELMRGPQGTLYGREATAGALNLVTKRPSFDGIEGYLDVEYGDFDHTRLKGAISLPVSEQLAFRVAAMDLNRDGYTKNLADGQVPGVDSDVDGRNFTAWRVTGEWRITDRINLWVMHDRFDEDDDKTYFTNVVCKQSALPVTGCEPDEFGLDLPRPTTAWWSISAALVGAIPLGAVGDDDGLNYDFPRPELGLREVHTDLEPRWRLLEEIWALGFDWTFDDVVLTATGGYRDTTRRAIQDFHMDVGFTLNPTPQNPDGQYPTSAPSGGIGAYRTGDRCNFNDYQAGVYGGCVTPVDQTRAFTYNDYHVNQEEFSFEVKIRSDLEGNFNYLAGAQHRRFRPRGDYYIMNNMIDLLATSPALFGVRLYPGFLFTTWNEREWSESYAAFGELYWEPTERLKITAGLRYNWDHSPAPNIEFYAFTAFDINGSGFLGAEPRFVRFPMGSWLSGAPSAEAIALADLYGATGPIETALSLDPTDPSRFPALVDALQLVPPVPDYGETIAVNDLELKEKWQEVSGRFAIDWLITPNTLLYASYTRGFQPGDVSPNRDELDRELVNAFELGAKSLLMNGSLRLNASVFLYDYSDLQFPASFVSLEGSNADANIAGVELETVWRPAKLPNLTLQFSYAWLDTELNDFQDFDPTKPTQDNSDWVRLKDFLPGAAGPSYIAPVADVLPLVDGAVAAGAAADISGTLYDNGIPAFFSRAFLEASGVTTLQGLPANLDGNALPNTPKHSVRISLSYSWYFSPGTLTARWDYYWQDDSYSRTFNTAGDRIDAWGQHNASLIFESANNKWSGRLWVRNIEDEDIVTGHRIQADAFGQFRSYFLTEPRIFGLSLGYSFGVD